MSNTIHEDGTALPDGATVPIGWSMPARAEDWQRHCIADREWCRVFKYVFHLKTGINLDELEDVLFPINTDNSEDGFAQISIVRLLIYITGALLFTGLLIGVSLGYQNSLTLWRTTWTRTSNNKYASRSKQSHYYRLKSVKTDGGDKEPLMERDQEKKA